MKNIEMHNKAYAQHVMKLRVTQITNKKTNFMK